tara:strand:- start:170 stop:616 length:447 start_codon:yes stop_codon:yes gene_type:complete
MDKNIENITEDLMMRYVDGDLDSDEYKKFKEILSQSEYLSNRASILKSIVDKQPLKTPSSRVHRKILSDVGLSDDSSISIIRRYVDSFMSIFENRPGLAGSFLSAFVVIILATFIIYSSISDYGDRRYITDEPIEENIDEKLEEDLTT